MAMLGSNFKKSNISIGGSHQMVSSDVIDLIYLGQFPHLGNFQTLVKVLNSSFSSFIGPWNITFSSQMSDFSDMRKSQCETGEVKCKLL